MYNKFGNQREVPYFALLLRHCLTFKFIKVNLEKVICHAFSIDSLRFAKPKHVVWQTRSQLSTVYLPPVTLILLLEPTKIKVMQFGRRVW